jgi:flagellar hook-associated protein 2
MASITTSGGVLDVNSLVTQLVAAEKLSQSAPITRHEVAVTTKISALGSLKGALATFKSALEPLHTTEAFQTRSTKLTDATSFSVAADATAVAGHYDVAVVDLAQSQQLGSKLFVGGSTSNVGSGQLNITLGSKSFAITVPPDGATLAEIRDAINTTSGNPGVQATLLNSTGGARLILTGASTGADEAIKVTASGGDGGLNQLVYDPTGTKNLSVLRTAGDAKIRIAGFDVTSHTNVFEDAIDGVTITAKATTEADKTVGLDVAVDTSIISGRIQTFVTAYNSTQATLGKLGNYNAQTQVAGALLGDSLLRGVQDQIRRDISNPVADVSGSFATLASIGITTTATGTLDVDTRKLNAALAADPAAIAQLFGSEDGVAARLYSQLQKRLSSNGDIETRNQGLNGELKGITDQKARLELRLGQIEARFRKQFVALDTLLTQSQSTASYLTQQLASLPKIGG